VGVVVVVVCELNMSSEQCLHSNYTVISTFALVQTTRLTKLNAKKIYKKTNPNTSTLAVAASAADMYVGTYQCMRLRLLYNAIAVSDRALPGTRSDLSLSFMSYDSDSYHFSIIVLEGNEV